MVYGYARVSSIDQNLARQIAAIEPIVDELITEKQSGKDFGRKNYNELVHSKMQEGDVLVVLSLDRLGRNYDEIKEEWRFITKELKADIRVLDMPLLDTTKSAGDLDTKFIADLVLQILSYTAQKERENMLARQKQGYAAARARGQTFGRPKKEIPQEIIDDVKAGKKSIRSACKELGISRSSWYNHERGTV